MSAAAEDSQQELPPLTWRSWLVLVMFILATIFVIYPVHIPIPIPTLRSGNNKKLAPWIAILVLLASTAITFTKEVVHGFVGSDGIEPYAIVILIFALAYICISLDQSGLLSYIAMHVTKRWGQNGRLLLLCFYVLSTVMAVLTSNDVVVLCLTPIICIFSDVTGADAEPFLMAMFIAANTASMALYIGNPTNIIASQANNISFLLYSAWMILPFLGAMVAGGIVLYLASLSKVPRNIDIDLRIEPHSMLTRPWQAVLGAVVLGLCLVALSVSSFFGVAVWIVTLPFGAVMLIVDIVVDLYFTRPSKVALAAENNVPQENVQPIAVEDKEDISRSPIQATSSLIYTPTEQIQDICEQDSTKNTCQASQSKCFIKRPFSRVVELATRRVPTVTAVVSRLPYSIVPFSLGMFIVIESLAEQGWTPRLAWLLKHICPSVVPTVFIVGAITALACNIMNNLPMTILFTRALKHSIFQQVDAKTRKGALFALIIGSNLGANFTLVGSLAGIMFQGIASQKKRDIAYFTFLRWCIPVLPVQLAVSCAILAIEMIVIK
ncbi:arsenical pump membrane protein-domain-containing protein [Coemansia spiralis]|nr:arsenical pump membrane protein-domain-containing protein [Coemansia spiralis]